MTKSEKIIELTNHYGAHNYLPLPIVISEAEGVWVKDPEGNKYMDMLSAYSAVNQGHRHPKIIQALKDQADKVTLVSRAFHSDNLGEWYEKICKLAGKDKALPMNTGAEAVETALKAARRWAYDVKGIEPNKAEIIAFNGNFHGRTMAPVSLSSEAEYQRGYGPLLDVFTPGSHGSTFGGNPLACAASIAALDVIVDEDLPGRSLELGDYFKEQLKQIDHPSIKEVRGRGLFIGVELNESARPYCEALKEEGLLCKETHDTVIRFAPPLIITKEELDLALEKIRHVFQ
ncbi:TPA: aminotransferase class III-fold pyridoxal phosphate-dependent enzyme [Staphylococcus aureus]|nr:aminotransferase class III-fold pyridoxal phosphate-dependent enzyme [Staphylococcus aureus]